MSKHLTPDLPFAEMPKTLRRLTRPERRAVHRVIDAVLTGAIKLPSGFANGQELEHLHAAEQKIEVRRRRG